MASFKIKPGIPTSFPIALNGLNRPLFFAQKQIYLINQELQTNGTLSKIESKQLGKLKADIVSRFKAKAIEEAKGFDLGRVQDVAYAAEFQLNDAVVNEVGKQVLSDKADYEANASYWDMEIHEIGCDILDNVTIGTTKAGRVEKDARAKEEHRQERLDIETVRNFQYELYGIRDYIPSEFDDMQPEWLKRDNQYRGPDIGVNDPECDKD